MADGPHHTTLVPRAQGCVKAPWRRSVHRVSCLVGWTHRRVKAAVRPCWPAPWAKGLACFFIGVMEEQASRGHLRRVAGWWRRGLLHAPKQQIGQGRVCSWQRRRVVLSVWRWALMAWQHVGDGQCGDVLWKALRWRWINMFDETQSPAMERGVLWLHWQARKWAQAPLSEETSYLGARNTEARVDCWSHPN